MSSGRPRTRIAVWDTARLAEVVAAAVERYFNGNTARAATKIGIERSLLNRLRNGKTNTLALSDLSRLRKLLSRDEFAEVEHSLVSPRAAEALAAFDAWVCAERERLLHRATATDTEVGRAGGSVPGWEMQRALEYQHLLDAARTRFSGLFNNFDRWLKRRAHSLSRGELAYIRILAPLLDCVESGCIERGWEEMSDKELYRFVEAGMAREKLLMARPSELQRAQQHAERDPVEFVTLYGQLWDPRAFTGRNTNELIKRWIGLRSGQANRRLASSKL